MNERNPNSKTKSKSKNSTFYNNKATVNVSDTIIPTNTISELP